MLLKANGPRLTGKFNYGAVQHFLDFLFKKREVLKNGLQKRL